MTFRWKAPPGWAEAEQEKLAEGGRLENKPSYPAQVWRTLPRTLSKAVADIPENTITNKIENHVLGTPVTWGDAAKRAAGSSTGHIVGALSAPLFFSGMEDAQSGDPKRRRAGVAKVMTSGALSGYVKGVIDGAVLKLPGAGMHDSGVAKMITSIPGALGALAVSKSNKDSEDDSPLVRYAKGGLIGGAAGAIKGGFQRGFVNRALYKTDRPKLYKLMRAGAIAQGVGGVLGGAVLSAFMDALKKPKGPPKLEKTAEATVPAESAAAEGLLDTTEIRPHQERMIRRMVDNGGVMVAAHGVGTGKTAASIAAFDRLRRYGMANRMLVVTPAGLRKNYADSVKKFSTFSTQVIAPKGDKSGVYYDAIDPSKSVTVVSYELFRQAPEKLMELTGADMLVLDEYHKIRDPNGSTYKAAVLARKHAPNFLGLTGSITNNDPSEVVTLANLAAGRVIMRPAQFNARYKRTVAEQRGFFGGKGKVTALRNVGDIKKQFGRYVDFLTTEDVGGDMPRKTVNEVHVPMSEEQRKIYEYALRSVDPITARKIRDNLPMDYKEAAQVFTMIMKARQAANSVAPFKANMPLEEAARRSPKVTQLLNDTAEHLRTTPDGQVVIYSNLINSGIDVLSAGLKERGIDHAIFVGKDREIGGEKITGDVRNQGVDDYLAGRKKVIVVSPAGAEGLDLRNSTLFQSLDGHFNPERTRQAEARARRLGGLSHRPQKDREVVVRRYFSVYPTQPWGARLLGRRTPTTTDQWINSVAERKHALNTQLVSAFKQPIAKGVPLKPMDIPPAPPKYIRRWKNAEGEWRYDYTA